VLEVAWELLVRLKGKMQVGRPAETILRTAKAREIDLIVMGVRGHGTLSGILPGSQSMKVLQHANCPVLVV
jgi:nucleotide-binding universal stress UspA family protein